MSAVGRQQRQPERGSRCSRVHYVVVLVVHLRVLSTKMAPRLFSKSSKSHKASPSDEELPHTVGDEFEVTAADRDEVFGSIEEDGPNYRDVSQHLTRHPRLSVLNSLGRMAWCFGPHPQIPNRSRCTGSTVLATDTRYRSGCSVSGGRCSDHHLVRMGYWYFQAQAPTSL